MQANKRRFPAPSCWTFCAAEVLAPRSLPASAGGSSLESGEWLGIPGLRSLWDQLSRQTACHAEGDANVSLWYVYLHDPEDDPAAKRRRPDPAAWRLPCAGAGTCARLFPSDGLGQPGRLRPHHQRSAVPRQHDRARSAVEGVWLAVCRDRRGVVSAESRDGLCPRSSAIHHQRGGPV